MRLRGQVTDFGDVLRHEEWLVKGRHLDLVWRVGVPLPTVATDRDRSGPATPATGEVNVVVDLQADKKVALSVEWTDEVGNPTDAPTGADVTYSVDEPTVINLIDNGDGTAVAAATGALGTATVHVEGTATGMPTATGDLQLIVVSGAAERLTVTAGPPEEITPDA